MTLTLTTTQAQEWLTVTLMCTGVASLPSAVIVIDGKAYAGLYVPTYSAFTYDIVLERGSHVIYGQATDSGGTVTTSPITYVMAYELTAFGIDLYNGDAKLDVIEPVLHDALLPDLPTLNFSCATLLTGSIGAVIRERGLRQYQFTIATVGFSAPYYQYSCKAAESYALTTAIMALQTAYGATSDAIRLLVPSLNIVNASLLSQTTYPQLFANTAPVDVIKQLLIQALAQASVRNGNLYVFPLDASVKQYDVTAQVSAMVSEGTLSVAATNANFGDPAVGTVKQLSVTYTYNGVQGQKIVAESATLTLPDTSQSPFNLVILSAFYGILGLATVDYHIQRLDPLTGWQRDADIYDAVRAHYIVKQFPTPATVLTLNDSDNWMFDGDWADVTETFDTLLPVPSGASGMLWTNGTYASRAGLSTLFRYFDRIRFNWNPVTATAVTISLQQDANNKLELTHAFAGQIGAGFVLNTGVASTDVLTKNIALDPIQYVTQVTGNTTANCSYRVTLLNAGGATLWQDEWRNTISNTFEANVPTSVSQTYQATTVRIEFTNLYLIADDYGVQCVTCYITKQTWSAVGTHQQVVSTVRYYTSTNVSAHAYNNYLLPSIICPVPALTGNQTYTVAQNPHGIYYVISGGPTLSIDLIGDVTVSGGNLIWYAAFGPSSNMAITGNTLAFYVSVMDDGIDYAWVSSLFVWSNAFNLFEPLDLAFVDFIRTGNPVNLQTIALTFAGDNYVDSLVLVADNPLPVTVQAGTGSKVFTVTDDFGSEAGAQAFANGLLPIVSVAREQYTRDVSLATDLSVGDTISGDGVPMTVYAVDYRQGGKTIAAGRAMDILKTQLREQARRLDALERKV